MPRTLARFIATGGTSPGVLLVIPQDAPVREVVETLILIWADDRAAGKIWRQSSHFRNSTRFLNCKGSIGCLT